MWIWAAMTTGGCRIHRRECRRDVSLICPRSQNEFFRRNRIKSNTGVDVPVVAVGKAGVSGYRRKMRSGYGDCDMVMLARPLLADPDWCNKAFAGNVEEIRPCIGCQEGCVNEFILGGHPQCAVNPRTGFEERFPETFTPAEKNEKPLLLWEAGRQELHLH